ncbi:TIM barrel protein [Paenibacillus mesophilus]|uniref:sugar phosphate isomerase/epimerase family protein n=1 Tax=Paenibacillus mesophilus TaxID=2582849 RepID=UPI00110F1FFB|nr:TIM barrel protein [Paenibacillus mesophilus]TMV49583.1 TIM barrel protein [Paenibacillus mesophilus]
MNHVYSLFPKMLGQVSVERLAGILQETGYDCVDLVVRDGFWVTPGGIKQEAASFVRSMQRSGIRVEFATTAFTPETLTADSSPLDILADLGVTGFRMGYFSYTDSIGLAVQLDKARGQMEKMAELCSARGMKAVYQVHHGYSQLIQHSFSALAVVKGLPPEHVGIMLDPGNQYHEGREHFGKAVSTLGEYWAGIGVKDVVMKLDPNNKHSPGKGWSAAWSPCHEGVINWHEIGKSVRQYHRPILFNVQPFYYPQDLALHTAAMKEELAYIHSAFGEANGSHEQA